MLDEVDCDAGYFDLRQKLQLYDNSIVNIFNAKYGSSVAKIQIHG